MGRFRGLRKFGRKAVRGLRKGKRVLGKAVGTAKTILGKVDKVTGGAATRMISQDPRGAAALAALNTADKVLN